MRIDQTQIREILSRTDIGAYIGTHVQLTKRGNDLVGLCPFHGEKSPSFHVHPDRGFFKCFGCGEGGDVIKFVMKLENVAFPEAARMLAKRSGIELEAESPEAGRMRGEREQIFAANELATAYFVAQLRSAPEAAAARAYVETRGFVGAAVDPFKLGFAPPGWSGLTDELSRNGVDLAIAAKAGLVKPGQRGYYDFYRNRLMIPTYATTGEVVAFGGRSLDGSEPKYLNTTTTPVYTKGRGLYALNVARRSAAKLEALIVVEGYLDCIALHQAGFTNAVASLGTAFTPEQAAELRKYAERIFLCFDGDAAGRTATAKSIEMLAAAGAQPFVVRLPAGEDPDTFVRANGPKGFAEKLEAALELYGSRFNVENEVDRLLELRLAPQSAMEKLAEYLRAKVSPAELDRLLSDGATRLGVPREELRKRVFAQRPEHFAPRTNGALPPAIGIRPAVRHVAPAAEPPSFEREVLAALVDEPALVDEYADTIPLEVFRESRYRDIYATLLVHRRELFVASDVYAALGEDRDAIEILVTLQKPDRSSRVRFQDSTARRAHLDRVVEGLMESRLEARRRELAARIDAAFTAGAQPAPEERDEHDSLVEELNRRKKRRLGAR